jgi:protein-disulfide isomerase
VTAVNAKQAKATTSKKGNRSFLALVAIVLAAGLAIISYVVLTPKPAAVVVDANLPLLEAKGYVMGSDSAPVEIVEFGDFECPACGQFVTITEPDIRSRLVATGLARFRFVDFPFSPSEHPSSMFAHNAAACANVQDKFWDMQDRIYTNQFEWSQLANAKDMNAPKIFKRYAKELGLDTRAFNACLDSRQFEPQIIANRREGERRNVGPTPTFFVGKRMIVGDRGYDVMKAMVDSATAEARIATPKEKAFGDTAGRKAK